MNCPEKKFKTRWGVGVGWGGSFRGSKSPGSVMNCPENEKKMLNPGGGLGGVEVLGVKML